MVVIDGGAWRALHAWTEDLALLSDLPDAGTLGLAVQPMHWRQNRPEADMPTTAFGDAKTATAQDGQNAQLRGHWARMARAKRLKPIHRAGQAYHFGRSGLELAPSTFVLPAGSEASG